MSSRNPASVVALPDAAIPPLGPGDHLTRDEFERRYYEAMPEGTKAELLEGVVYMPPPAVRWDYHASPHANLIAWMVLYRAQTPGVEVGDTRVHPAGHGQRTSAGRGDDRCARVRRARAHQR